MRKTQITQPARTLMRVPLALLILLLFHFRYYNLHRRLHSPPCSRYLLGHNVLKSVWTWVQEPPCRCKRRGHRWERRCSTCLQDPALPTSACPSPSFPRSPGLMGGTVPPSDNPAWSPFLVSTSQPCQEEQCCLPGGPLKAEGSDPTSSLLPASPDVSQLFPITCSALHILRAKIPLPADPCSHSSDNLLHTSCSHHPFSPCWL